MKIILDINNLHEILRISGAKKVAITEYDTVIAENNNIQIISKLECCVKERGSTIIPKNIIALMPKVGEAVITENSISCGKRTITFEKNSESISEIQVDNILTVLPKKDMDFLSEVDYAIAKDETRPILLGIHFENSATCALDGYRMSVRKSNTLNINSEFTIPAEMIKIFKKIKSTANVEIALSKNYAKLRCGNISIVGKILEGKFVNYKALIPNEFRTTISLNKTELFNVLKSYKDVRVVKLGIEKNALITTANIEEIEKNRRSDKNKSKSKNNYRVIATIEDKFKCHLKGEELNIAFNALYLKEAIAMLDKEECKIKFNSCVTAAIISEEVEEGERIEIINPTRRY